ncbi:MAG TPA: hypothetical protein VFL14_03670 [Xanthomonadales bacterium]|nr:hypothetical protein [Xanthomonadales bacterium]
MSSTPEPLFRAEAIAHRQLTRGDGQVALRPRLARNALLVAVAFLAPLAVLLARVDHGAPARGDAAVVRVAGFAPGTWISCGAHCTAVELPAPDSLLVLARVAGERDASIAIPLAQLERAAGVEEGRATARRLAEILRDAPFAGAAP